MKGFSNAFDSIDIQVLCQIMQGDSASPTVFDVVYNICLRMIVTSGHTITMKGVGNHNTGGYADDAAIITSSPSSMNHILNNVLASFCNFTGMRVNITKTEISGIDYSTGRELPTENIRCEGAQLDNIDNIRYEGAQLVSLRAPRLRSNTWGSY